MIIALPVEGETNVLIDNAEIIKEGGVIPAMFIVETLAKQVVNYKTSALEIKIENKKIKNTVFFEGDM